MADSDWKSRATPITPDAPAQQDSTSDWMNRATPVQEESGVGEALLRGAAHGATMGFDDRIEAGAKSLFADQDYDKLLKDIRDRNKKVEAEHPYASTAGKIAGGVGGILAGGAALRGAGALAKGIGLASEAAEGAGALAEGANAVSKGSKLGEAIKGGAAFGAASGLGETEDLTDIPQALKDTAEGAAGGAVGGAVLTGAGGALKGLGRGIASSTAKLGDIVGEVPLITPIIKGAKGQFQGKSFSPAETRKEVSNTVENELVPRINQLDDYLSKKYDNFLDNKQLNIAAKEVEGLSPMTQQELAPLITKEGAAGPADTSVMARDIDDLKKTIQGKIKLLSNTSDPDKLEMLQQFQQTAKELNGIIVDKGGQEYNNLNTQYKLLSNAKARLNNLEDTNMDIGSQKGQSDYYKTVQQLTNDLTGTEGGNAEKANKLNDSMDFLKTAENWQNQLEGKPLDKGVDDLKSKLLNKAADYNTAVEGATESELSPNSHTLGFSPRAYATKLGRVGGQVAKTTTEAAQIPLALVRNLSTAVSEQSPVAANLISSLNNSTDAMSQKAGKLLKDVMSDPDHNKRNALMFTLSQQPWFRDVVHKHVNPENSSGQ